MFCVQCGKQLPDGAKFCAGCGAPQPGFDAPAAVTPPEPAQAQPEPAVVEMPAPEPVEPPAPPVEEVPVDQMPQMEPVTQSFEPPAAEIPVQASPAAPVFMAAEPAPVSAPVATMEAPPKKKGKKVLVIAIAAVLVVAILAVGGYFGYGYYTDLQTYDKAVALMEDGEYEDALKLFKDLDIKDSAKKVKELETLIAEADKGDEEPGEDDDEPEDLPEVELVINEAKLEYTLTEADIEAFYQLLTECEETVLTSDDPEAIRQIIDAIDAKYEELEAQYVTAMVLYYCDLTDDEASELYLSCVDMATEADNEYLAMSQRIYESEAFGRDLFFEDWTDTEIAMMLSYTEEVMELQQRNSEIEVAYQDLQEDPDMYEKMVPLYVEMVQNNNRIAQICGYDNYYEYAYELVYDRDYDPSQIHTMRGYAADYIAPALEGAMEQFLADAEDLSIGNSMKLSALLFETFDEDYVTDYLAVLPEQMRTDMLDMFDGNILLMEDVDGAMEGGFTTDIGSDRSVCFFGPGYSNILTVIHEVGHYYGSKHELLSDIPLDLAETHSQGNEWLFISHLEGELSKKLHKTMVDYKMYNDLGIILISLIVDEFEERVYTHPDVASLTSQDLDAIMEEVCQPYGGTDYFAEVLTDVQEYWRMVVVEQPVYYISYGVSAVASMDLYTMAQDDFDEALEAYRSLVEEIDLDDGFLGNITAAGIASPFDEKIYKDLMEIYE